MGTRSEALARQFEEQVAELAKTIESRTNAQWQAICGEEKWTVAATAHHVGAQFGLEKEYLLAAAGQGTPPPYTWDDINKLNDSRAAENKDCSKEKALQQLRDGAATMAAYVRGLSDEQLDSTAPLGLADGALVSTEQLILGGVLIDHVRAHNASIRAAG